MKQNVFGCGLVNIGYYPIHCRTSIYDRNNVNATLPTGNTETSEGGEDIAIKTNSNKSLHQ